jgi:hypothetical protein
MVYSPQRRKERREGDISFIEESTEVDSFVLSATKAESTKTWFLCALGVFAVQF